MNLKQYYHVLEKNANIDQWMNRRLTQISMQRTIDYSFSKKVSIQYYVMSINFFLSHERI